jgi:fructan beta-fructosidase
MKHFYFIPIVVSNLFWQCRPESKVVTNSNYHMEQYRPQYHFTPKTGWMNDPNGMVYYEGEYHLFYQHFPDSNVWGPMHWGHAVSSDLVHWEHLPIALYPDQHGMIFSGSAVIDYKNTSSLGSVDKPAMVAIFTQHSMEGEKAGRHDFQTQGIAYSNDKGRTWTMYQQNPVIKNPGKHDFRDPKVFWHDASQQWVMILAVKDHVELYSSKDLKDWKYQSDFGNGLGEHDGVWECPDLFEMKMEGTDKKRWVMLVSINPGAINGGSGTQYFIGDFDGKSFHSDTETSSWLDYGKDNYAGVSWNNIPDADGRKLFIGWMSNWQYATIVPTYVWRSATTVARTLALVETESGWRVSSNPVEELRTLRMDSIVYDSFLSSNEKQSKEIKLDQQAFELDFLVERDQLDDGFEIEFSNSKNENLRIQLDAKSNQFNIDRTRSGIGFSKDFVGIHSGNRSYKEKNIQIKLLVDDSSLEIFIDNGTLVMTELLFPSEPFSLLKIKSNGGVTIKTVALYPLKGMR